MTLELHTGCAIVGEGPAGLVPALALLRHGIRVTVLETQNFCATSGVTPSTRPRRTCSRRSACDRNACTRVVRLAAARLRRTRCSGLPWRASEESSDVRAAAAIPAQLLAFGGGMGSHADGSLSPC